MNDSKNKGFEMSSESLEKVDGGTIYKYEYVYKNEVPYYLVGGKKFDDFECALKYAKDHNISTDVVVESDYEGEENFKKLENKA